jgi:hypothetical protein
MSLGSRPAETVIRSRVNVSDSDHAGRDFLDREQPPVLSSLGQCCSRLKGVAFDDSISRVRALDTAFAFETPSSRLVVDNISYMQSAQ